MAPLPITLVMPYWKSVVLSGIDNQGAIVKLIGNTDAAVSQPHRVRRQRIGICIPPLISEVLENDVLVGVISTMRLLPESVIRVSPLGRRLAKATMFNPISAPANHTMFPGASNLDHTAVIFVRDSGLTIGK